MSRPQKSSSKPVKTPRSSKKSGGSTLTGVFVGLVVGVAVAAGVVWYMNKSTITFQDRSNPPAADSGKKPVETTSTAPAGTPEPLPGKPGDKAGDKPRFEFYNILPGKQDAAPDTQAAPATTPEPAAQAAAAVETFYLQVGAFQKAADADNLKAKLALLGIEASIQEVNSPDKGKLLRVRAGPFAKPEEMNKARNELAANGIQGTVIKIKDATN